MAFTDTPFFTGAKDTLAKADVYNEKRDTAINKKADKINSNLDVLDRVKNDPKYLKNLLASFKQGKEKQVINSNTLLSRLNKLMKGDYSLIEALLPDQLAVLFKLYETKDRRNSYRINGKTKRYTTAEIDSYTRANAILDTVAPVAEPVDPDIPVVTPDPTLNTVSDVSSQVAILTQVITTFSDLHDSASIANAIARITDPEVKKEVYYAILDSLVRSSDLDNIDAAADFLGSEALLAHQPSIIIDLLSNFAIPVDVRSTGYDTLQTKLLALLIKINPYWYLTIRGNSTVRNLKPYILMSDDAKTIIATNVTHRATCMIADSYREVNIVDVASGYFPTAPL